MKIEIPVTVESTSISEKHGTSRLGKSFYIREQFAYVDMGKPYPVEVRIPVQTNAPPYPSGRYLVDPSCIYVDRFGQLAIGRIKLVPLPSQESA